MSMAALILLVVVAAWALAYFQEPAAGVDVAAALALGSFQGLCALSGAPWSGVAAWACGAPSWPRRRS